MKLRCNGFYDIQLVGVIFRHWKEYQTEDNSSFRLFDSEQQGTVQAFKSVPSIS